MISVTGKILLLLGRMLDIEVIHLDAHYWKPGWIEPSEEEWLRRVERLTRRDAWIMDGNYTKTIDIRLTEADTVIFLDSPASSVCGG